MKNLRKILQAISDDRNINENFKKGVIMGSKNEKFSKLVQEEENIQQEIKETEQEIEKLEMYIEELKDRLNDVESCIDILSNGL